MKNSKDSHSMMLKEVLMVIHNELYALYFARIVLKILVLILILLFAWYLQPFWDVQVTFNGQH